MSLSGKQLLSSNMSTVWENPPQMFRRSGRGYQSRSRCKSSLQGGDFNHASQLDLRHGKHFAAGWNTLVKREFLYIPLLGQVLYAFDVTTIDRGNLQKRRVHSGGRLTRRSQQSLFISPEDSHQNRELGPFKMGAFYLAESMNAPIVPAIIRGAGECQPMGKLFCTPGVVQIEFLDDIPTDDFQRGDLHRHRDALRSIYLEALEKRD